MLLAKFLTWLWRTLTRRHPPPPRTVTRTLGRSKQRIEDRRWRGRGYRTGV